MADTYKKYLVFYNPKEYEYDEHDDNIPERLPLFKWYSKYVKVPINELQTLSNIVNHSDDDGSFMYGKLHTGDAIKFEDKYYFLVNGHYVEIDVKF